MSAEDRLAAVEALFSGGPDTECRTVWREESGMFDVTYRVECVEVPLDSLRAALATPTTYPDGTATREHVEDRLDVAAIQAATLREAADELIATGPGVNAELRYDGTPDPEMSAYVEGLRDAWQLLTSRADRLAEVDPPT